MMRNSSEILASFQAVWALGAAVVPLLPKLTAGEVRYLIEHSGASTALASLSTAPVISEARAGLRRQPRLLVFGPSQAPGAEEITAEIEAATPFEMPVECAPDEMAVLLYTPGTAGRPKGVIQTHRNLFAAVDSYVRISPHMERCAMMHVLPLSHAYGILMIQLAAAWGFTTILMPSFNPNRVLRAIQDYKVRRIAMVPAMMIALMGHEDRSKYDTSSLRKVVSGGAALTEDVRLKFETVFHCEVNQGYGLSETAAVAVGYGDHEPYRPGSIGHATPGTDVCILGAADQPLGPRQAGEICLRGDTIMPGYWHDSESTREAFLNSWFRTGDVGCMDEDGYIYITDRKKDLIIKGGENISPREIEKVIRAHPAVAEAAVVGMPDPVMGEEVCAVVVLKEGTWVTEDQIRHHAALSVARFKVPARVVFQPVLPRNAKGEVLKREIAGRVSAFSGHALRAAAAAPMPAGD
jgi:long-chain acyl-CoA synthetase